MTKFYIDINEIKDPKFRKLINSNFDELLKEVTQDEEIIGVFEKDDINVALYIDCQGNFDKFMSGIKSGHFTSYNFYATAKKIIIHNPLIPPPLNLSFLHLSIKQKIILPDYILNVEKATAEKRLAAIELRNEIRKEDGIEPGFTPTVGNSGQSIKIKSRSNSAEGIKKSVSFKDILTEEHLINRDNITNDSTNDSLSTLENSIERILF